MANTTVGDTLLKFKEGYLTFALLWNLKYDFHFKGGGTWFTLKCWCGPTIVLFHIEFSYDAPIFVTQRSCPKFPWIYLHIFSISRDTSHQSIHATLKMGKCEDGYLPTCILDNTANPLSHMLLPPPPPPPQGSACPSRCLKILAKASLMPLTIFCFTGTQTWKCALTYILKTHHSNLHTCVCVVVSPKCTKNNKVVSFLNTKTWMEKTTKKPTCQCRLVGHN